MLDDLNIYITFVLYAIYGKTGTADALMREHGDAVRRAADQLRQRLPFERKSIYRGMLLDPTAPLVMDPRLTFVSWSEDRDVARWFASRDSVISEPLAASNSKLRGFVLTRDRAPENVLFHYSWASAFGFPLERFALQHPHMGLQGYQQIGWSLRTQQEVITEPLAVMPKPEAVEAVDGPDVRVLDARYTPPWCTEAAS